MYTEQMICDRCQQWIGVFEEYEVPSADGKPRHKACPVSSDPLEGSGGTSSKRNASASRRGASSGRPRLSAPFWMEL